MVRKGAIAALALTAGLAVGGMRRQEEGRDAVELKGTLSFGVLAPVERTGRARQLVPRTSHGRRAAAVDEINASGGVLGKKLELEIVDDACDAQVGYEAAKAFVSDGDRSPA